MNHFFLITTDHLRSSLLFRNADDFAAGMNFVAIVAYLTQVEVLSFVLMSNHVHFVVCCSRQEAERFVNLFKTHYSAYYQRKYGGREFLRRLKINLQQVHEEDESVKKAIAYVQMNPVAANLCMQPSMYEWGTGNSFFNPALQVDKKLGDISFVNQRAILHSKTRLPQDYFVTGQGYIHPSSFTAVAHVEDLFRTPKSMQFFLNNSSKARSRMEKSAAPTFDDQLLLLARNNLLMSLFRVSSINELSTGQKRELINQLQRRFSSDLRQVCRVIGMDYEEAAALINSI